MHALRFVALSAWCCVCHVSCATVVSQTTVETVDLGKAIKIERSGESQHRLSVRVDQDRVIATLMATPFCDRNVYERYQRTHITRRTSGSLDVAWKPAMSLAMLVTGTYLLLSADERPGRDDPFSRGMFSKEGATTSGLISLVGGVGLGIAGTFEILSLRDSQRTEPEATRFISSTYSECGGSVGVKNQVVELSLPTSPRLWLSQKTGIRGEAVFIIDPEVLEAVEEFDADAGLVRFGDLERSWSVLQLDGYRLARKKRGVRIVFAEERQRKREAERLRQREENERLRRQREAERLRQREENERLRQASKIAHLKKMGARIVNPRKYFMKVDTPWRADPRGELLASDLAPGHQVLVIARARKQAGIIADGESDNATANVFTLADVQGWVPARSLLTKKAYERAVRRYERQEEKRRRREARTRERQERTALRKAERVEQARRKRSQRLGFPSEGVQIRMGFFKHGPGRDDCPRGGHEGPSDYRSSLKVIVLKISKTGDVTIGDGWGLKHGKIRRWRISAGVTVPFWWWRKKGTATLTYSGTLTQIKHGYWRIIDGTASVRREVGNQVCTMEDHFVATQCLGGGPHCAHPEGWEHEFITSP